jgi:hypothetical protein
MSKASLATNASFKWRNIIHTNCPTHPATASFGTVTNSLTKWNGFCYRVFQRSDNFDVLT